MSSRLPKSVSAKLVWKRADLADPQSDLCARGWGGYYDVVHGVDGWSVSTPAGFSAEHFTDRAKAQEHAEFLHKHPLAFRARP